MTRAAFVATMLTILMVTSVVALPVLGGGSPFADGTAESVDDVGGQDSNPGAAALSQIASTEGTFEPVAMGSGSPAEASLSQETEEAVEDGVDEGIALVQAQGIEVTQEQRTVAVEGAQESAAQHQEATVEQVQAATTGAVHGALLQEQRVEVEQIQIAVGGATDGALEQHQTATATQLQSATWGATHGALAQAQRVTVEQLQVATRGAAAGAASEAGERDIDRVPVIQEAAQGSAYGVLEQYQKLTVEQRQQVTLDHVQHAAAGAAAGALEGSTPEALEQIQEIEIEQYQQVTIKQVQKAAVGAAKGALVQQQTVTVEQTQAAARGAGAGSLVQVQLVRIEQVQRITVTQIQEASFGAAKGAIVQSQEATVEQIQAAALGGSQGVLVQQQEVTITQIQHAAVGASKGAVESAIQYQVVEVEQIQAAAFGAGEGAVVQTQVVDVVQVQQLAAGASSGSLSQHQTASVEQIQTAAKGASQETARLVQEQRISITQLQVLTQESAAAAAAFAAEEGIDDEAEIVQFLEVEIEQRLEVIDEVEGEARLSFPEQETDGETVVVDSVELSEGGFVAVYDEGFFAGEPTESLVGVSGYLEPGEYEGVEIDLEEPLEEDRQLIAVAHLDTNENEAFDYVDTGGEEDVPYVGPGGIPVMDQAIVGLEEEPEPEATLLVDDQEADGETLFVEEASATVDYAITVEYDGERVESEQFEAEETVEELELELEPPIEEDTTVEVAVIDADEEELAGETIEYELEDPDPDATLEVADQEGDGETLLVGSASAAVDFAVVAEYDDERVESEFFEAEETVTGLELELEPPIEENTTAEIVVVDADGEVLASETIEYVIEEPDPDPTAELSVENQQGDGQSLAVAEASATVEYALTVTDEDDQRLAETDLLDADETIENESIPLEPPLEDDATLEVALVGADGEELASETVDYAFDPGFEVEFVDCTRAEVTASLEDGDQVAASTGFYDAGGFGNTIIEDFVTVGEDVEAPFTGTIVFEVGAEDDFTDEDEITVGVEEYGLYGTFISGISSPEAIPTATIDHPHPEAEACLEEVRPDEPSIAVTDATVGEDAIDVTFGYENPNDAPLFVGSEFVEGTTAEEPPTELEPGEGEFTVEWTPQDDEERLVWEVDLSRYEYDEPLTAATPTAGELEPDEPEPAAFAVEIVETNAPVEQGGTLEVVADLANVGEEEGTQEIALAIDGTEVDSTTISLEPDESETVTLLTDTMDFEPGEYTATVSSEDDTAATTVSIEAPDEPAEDPVEEDEQPVDEDEPAEDPTDEPGDDPAEEPADDPTEDPVDEPIDDPTEEPVDEPADDEADGPAEDPAADPADDPDNESANDPAVSNEAVAS
ncbi:hypothetical protein CV102_07300 [Natronococcus pandeyae]|uniref:DUF7282 domain-containing protein n=1 Tax=Natronococcus pandeyae TaxID=2055836 RepID=A0A8J8Q4U4_9EURY|nr:hypothetical protein [Natronococcus pandeyae]TYL39092.1 hypothetical protein CV102_07300 [Natronococcus pandeyae]